MNDGRPVTRRTFGQALGLTAMGHVIPLRASAAPAPAGQATAPVASGEALCDSSAVDLAARLRRKEVSAVEVMTAHLARIAPS